MGAGYFACFWLATLVKGLVFTASRCTSTVVDFCRQVVNFLCGCEATPNFSDYELGKKSDTIST
jgi:hypothetical protein